MTSITFKGNPVSLSGTPPTVGQAAPGFRLTRADLGDVGLDAWAGKRKVLNVVPSLDTGVCAQSARTFNQAASDLGDDVVILTISRDLPFAQKRFCAAEGIERVETLSEMRDREFGRTWGLEMIDGPLAGLLARAVFVLDADDVIRYVELVPEIAQEPDYGAALAALPGIAS